MTPAAQPETIGESQKYWTHGVETFPSPVAQFRMAQLVDFDDRLYETARVVYRFMVGWYHEGYGDALLSQRHVARVMKQRAPAGASVPSRNAVQRAIITLMDTGWVVRSFQGRGKGKGASRYVPVMNVLELAAQGKFPEPAHATGPVELAHHNGPVVAHHNGPVDDEPAHATGPKTLLPDSAGEPKTGKEDIDFAPPAPALAGGAAAKEGYDDLYAAYGVRAEYAAGRIEYEKLAPSADLHAEMVQAAKAWRDAAGDIARMHLARWIRERRFLEDPKERKAKSAKPEPAAASEPPEPGNDNTPDFMRGSPKLWPVGRHYGEFVEGEVVRQGGDTEVRMTFRRDDGKLLLHHFYIDAFIKSFQDEGQAFFRGILDALGMSNCEDTDELLFKPLAVTADGETLTYSSISEAA
jgi:hypothetical protein